MNRPAAVLLADTGAGRDRTQYLGGSDIAALMGLSKWTTPLQLWEKKTGRDQEAITPEKQKLFDRGHRWEQPAFDMLMDELAARGFTVEVTAANRRFADAEFPFLQSERDREILLTGELPDGTVLSRAPVTVEIKTVHAFAAGEWGEMDTDEVPIYYATQVMHGLGLSENEWAICAALFGADNIVPYFIKRDDETIDAMRAKAVEFWNVNVLGGREPDPINMEDMLRMFAKKNGRPADVDEDTAVALANLSECRARIKTYEGDEEALKFKVCEGIRRAWGLLPDTEPDDNAVIRFNGQEIGSWKKQRRESIDTKALRKHHPLVAEECTKVSHTRILRTK